MGPFLEVLWRKLNIKVNPCGFNRESQLCNVNCVTMFHSIAFEPTSGKNS